MAQKDHLPSTSPLIGEYADETLSATRRAQQPPHGFAAGADDNANFLRNGLYNEDVLNALFPQDGNDGGSEEEARCRRLKMALIQGRAMSGAR